MCNYVTYDAKGRFNKLIAYLMKETVISIEKQVSLTSNPFKPYKYT